MRHVANNLSFGSGLGLLLGALLAGACFNPPSDPVQFACEPDDAAECPDGYECRADGCCHREDTPSDDAVAACKLGVGGASGLPPPSTTPSSASDGSPTGDSSGSATDATGDTGATTSTGTTSTDAGTTDDSTGTGTGGSTDTGTTGAT